MQFDCHRDRGMLKHVRTTAILKKSCLRETRKYLQVRAIIEAQAKLRSIYFKEDALLIFPPALTSTRIRKLQEVVR